MEMKAHSPQTGTAAMTVFPVKPGTTHAPDELRSNVAGVVRSARRSGRAHRY